MPVFAKHATDPDAFDKTSMTPLVGSGPYTVVARRCRPLAVLCARPAVLGPRSCRSIADASISTRSASIISATAPVMLEAFKRGAIDMRLEEDPGRWANAYDIEPVRDGRILKKEFEIGLPAGMTALVFNTRREVFADPPRAPRADHAVRFRKHQPHALQRPIQAHAKLFRTLVSVVRRKPADATERALLAPFASAVRPEIPRGHIYVSQSATAAAKTAPTRKRRSPFLNDAGYELRGGALVNSKTGAAVDV